jgi:two-component system sensor kinase FixL
MQNEELRDTQIQLQDSRDSYSELYELAPVGYLTLDAEGVIQTANLTACTLFGLERSALISTKFARHVAADDQDRLHRTLRCLGASKEKQSLDCRILDQGQHIWIHAECSVRESNPNESLVTLSDISRRKRAEELLREQETQLAHVARISCMGEMVGGIAHEVTQPLFAISNLASTCELTLTQGRTDRTEQLITMNRMIAEQAVHAGEILKRLRSFIEPSNVIRSALDINDVIGDSLKLTESQSRCFDSKVNLALADKLPNVVGDRVQIQQVVVNLLLNAFESMVDRAPEERLVTVNTCCREDSVEVAVEDNGEGLSPETADTVFDAFVTTKTAGMGLGLTISRSIIHAHCGSIWVTPKTDRGARFHFRLPVATEADA